MAVGPAVAEELGHIEGVAVGDAQEHPGSRVGLFAQVHGLAVVGPDVVRFRQRGRHDGADRKNDRQNQSDGNGFTHRVYPPKKNFSRFPRRISTPAGFFAAAIPFLLQRLDNH